MADKEAKDYWSDCGQIFFHHGKGYVLTPDLGIIPLGSEEDILKALDTKKLKSDLTSLQRRARYLIRFLTCSIWRDVRFFKDVKSVILSSSGWPTEIVALAMVFGSLDGQGLR